MSRPHKLSRETAVKVRAVYGRGTPTAVVARQFDVSKPVVLAIVHGRYPPVADLPDIFKDPYGRARRGGGNRG